MRKPSAQIRTMCEFKVGLFWDLLLPSFEAMKELLLLVTTIVGRHERAAVTCYYNRSKTRKSFCYLLLPSFEDTKTLLLFNI